MKTVLAGFTLPSLLARMVLLFTLIFAAVMPTLAADRMMEPPGGSLEDLQARMFAGVPDAYSGAEIKGRIVDAENGEPIEGAVVVASWHISKTIITPDFPLFWTSRRERLFYVTEALSDREGRYVIAAWGPIERPADWRRKGPRDPQLAIFKSGYEPVYPNNALKENGQFSPKPFNSSMASILHSIHDGEDIALCRYGKCEKKTLAPLNIDSRETRTPEQISKDKVESFASHLERNVRPLADDPDARDGSPLRLDAIRRQHQAILSVHEELQKLGKIAGKAPCYPGCHSWSPEIEKFIKSEYGNK